jgi:uncharacterized protein (DUF362 family)
MSIENNITRRDFLKLALTTGVTVGLAPSWMALGAPQPPDGTPLWVIYSTDKQKLMRKALEIIFENGGFGSHPDTLTLKVNAAWARTPDEGANTHPQLVDTFLKGCREAGITKLTVPENPCNNARYSFTRSGIEDAVKQNDATMIDLGSETRYFAEYGIPEGKELTSANVARQFTECDVLVNMPVAKHHGGATLTMAMKNWMGAVQDRGFWHRNSLHQCIADFSTFIKPQWTIIDATRIMLNRGPQGPTDDMKTPNLLIVSRDPVAADSFTTTLFHDSIDKVRYLKIAREMNIGQTYIHKMKITRVAA